MRRLTGARFEKVKPRNFRMRGTHQEPPRGLAAAPLTTKSNVVLSGKPAQDNTLRKPGEKPGGPGIYKCQTCGFEDVINRERNKLPPCSNCDNEGKGGSEYWKFLVKAIDE